MTMEITEDDVGRWAVVLGTENRECVYVGKNTAIFRRVHDDHLIPYYLNGKPRDAGYAKLTCWRPNYVKLPFRWWTVAKGNYNITCQDTRSVLVDGMREEIGAVIYARTLPEDVPFGTWHTEEDAQKIRAEAAEAYLEEAEARAGF